MPKMRDILKKVGKEACRQRGVDLADLSFDQQNVLWEEAKRGVGE